MTRIEDQLGSAARQLRQEINGAVDVDAALRQTISAERGAPSHVRRVRGPMVLAVAAVVVVVGLVVSGVLRGGDGDRTIVAAGPTSSGPQPSTSTSTVIEDDLRPPAPGREITFDGVAEMRLDQVLDPSAISKIDESSSCGYWGPGEPSHDGDEPLDGLVAGADTPEPWVISVVVRRNPTYRTASGVGVGTTLASLQRVYGNELVVDRVDQAQEPTDGLRGYYTDVAAVRSGDRALTFYLLDDVVDSVKVSHADFWGDDEGCA